MYNYSYSADTVCACVNGRLVKSDQRPIRFTAYHTDFVCDDTLFVPLGGSKTDGHRFLSLAIAKGASAVFFEKGKMDEKDLPDGNYSAIEVDDALVALGKFAAFHRTQCPCFVIGITGSVGKTTTKQLLKAVFSVIAPTVATHENDNNELGVPMTLLSISPHDAYAIVEMGMSGFGEISYLSKIVQPDLAIITNIGTAHIGKLGGRSAIAQAKAEIIDGLRKGGKVILDGDEPLLAHIPNKITVSQKDFSCDYTLCDYLSLKDTATFRIDHHRHSTLCALMTAGIHCAYDATLAFAAAKESGICDAVIQEGLQNYRPSSMRQTLHHVNGYTLIEDCYNASYESMIAALTFTKEYALQNGGRAIAILGDMLELGDESVALHREIGIYAAKIGISSLYVCGEYASDLIEGFLSDDIKKTAVSFPIPSANEEISISFQFQEKDAILLKASRAVHLERLLPIILSSSI